MAALSPAATRRLAAAGALLFAGYFAVWGGEYSAFDLADLREQRVEAEARLADTRAENDSLRAAARRLERDPATIEQVARERFGMIREGELLYRFVPVDSVAAASAAP